MSERLRELAALRAVGELDPKQQAEYDALVAGSGDARAEAAAFESTAAALAAAAEPVAPSAGLRSSLLAQIAVTPQLPPVEPAALVTDGTVAEDADTRPETPTDPSEHPVGPVESAARRRWFTRPAVIIGSAAAALALFFGGTVVGIGIAQNSFSVEQATALAELQAAPDAQQSKTVLEDGTSATLIWSLEQRRSAIMIDDLDALPEGETYQLWYIGEDSVVADGTFEAAPEGTTWRVLDGLMSEGDAVGVTIEPEGGSSTPSGDPIIVIGSA